MDDLKNLERALGQASAPANRSAMTMWPALAATLLGACGPTYGFGTFNGAVAGHTIIVRDAVFRLPYSSTSGRWHLVLSDLPGLCYRLGEEYSRWGETRLEFTVSNASGEIGPGEYAVDPTCCPGGTTRAHFHQDCGEVAVFAMSGRLNISAVVAQRGGGANGTFDVTFVGKQTDNVTGSFAALFCEPTSTIDPGFGPDCR